MIGIISDIHGNYVALSAVLTQLDEMGVSEIICLGDIGGYYCQINECCEELQNRKIFSLMGNHDWYLATGEGCPRSNSANVCLDFQRGVISSANLDWLASLPSEANIYGINIVHGGWRNPIDEYLNPTKKYFSEISGRYFASGHTHVQCNWSGEGKIYCNPGSVGQPRDGDPRTAFAIWDGSLFSLHRIDYDIHCLQQTMMAAGFAPYYYENLDRGRQIGNKIDDLSLIPPIHHDNNQAGKL
ncbi:MAG: metallophosphoesterase [Desulfobacteraceae bacterium]|nr:MAG: metallophosphoesterase [Desulfobacteraceae bacterium]